MDRGSAKTKAEYAFGGPAQGAERFVLVVTAGVQKGERFVVGRPGFIGRDPKSLCVVHEPGLRFAHLQLRLDSDDEGHETLVLMPNAGADPAVVKINGTSLVDAARLVVGQEIVIGDTTLRCERHGVVELEFDKNVMERLTRDDVTGLCNRRRFEMDLRARIEQAWREAKPMAFAVLDIDGLKRINDKHGHLAGAEVIKAVGKNLGRTLGHVASVARIGGDEFAVAIPRTPEAQAVAMLTAAQGMIAAERIHAGDLVVQVTASFGAAMVPAATADSADDVAKKLFLAADKELLARKAARQ